LPFVAFGWWQGLDTIGWRYPGAAPGWEYDTIQYMANSIPSPTLTSTLTNNPCPLPALYGPGHVDDSCSFNHFWSNHNNGANFLFADGSVRFLSYDAQVIMRELSTREGGEVVDHTSY
jgi:prepilin-type processing-associated H-X9-DG protein